MFLSAAALAATLIAPPAHGEAIKLNRVFAKGEKAQYEIKSTMNSESRQLGLQTWIPSDLDIHYKFTVEVLAMKADGIVDLKYLRPSITEIQGETVNSGPKSRVEKTNDDLLLTVSPANEILKIKDMAKKDEKPPAKPKPPTLKALRSGSGLDVQGIGGLLGGFIGEIQRLSLFLGPLDSSMDFAPKLPFEEVQPGDTWKRTAGYSPQKLKGKGDKLAVQRLDYLYTYVGVVDSGSKKVHRVTADLEVKTDLAEFVHQTYDVKSDETGLKEIPLSFKGKIEFDLDLKTMKTVRAVGTSEGGFQIVVTEYPNEPVIEQKLRGRTILKLLNP